MKIKIVMKSEAGGDFLKEIEAVPFNFQILEKKYKFAFHKGSTLTSITHIASGRLVTEFTDTLVNACLGNKKSAAIITIKRLVEEYGAQRISDKLDSLLKIKVGK